MQGALLLLKPISFHALRVLEVFGIVRACGGELQLDLRPHHPCRVPCDCHHLPLAVKSVVSYNALLERIGEGVFSVNLPPSYGPSSALGSPFDGCVGPSGQSSGLESAFVASTMPIVFCVDSSNPCTWLPVSMPCGFYKEASRSSILHSSERNTSSCVHPNLGALKKTWHQVRKEHLSRLRNDYLSGLSDFPLRGNEDCASSVMTVIVKGPPSPYSRAVTIAKEPNPQSCQPSPPSTSL